jgi:hypothetical protein
MFAIKITSPDFMKTSSLITPTSKIAMSPSLATGEDEEEEACVSGRVTDFDIVPASPDYMMSARTTKHSNGRAIRTGLQQFMQTPSVEGKFSVSKNSLVSSPTKQAYLDGARTSKRLQYATKKSKSRPNLIANGILEQVMTVDYKDKAKKLDCS